MNGLVSRFSLVGKKQGENKKEKEKETFGADLMLGPVSCVSLVFSQGEKKRERKKKTEKDAP